MRKFKKFGPNDKVFAKVRGYPPWPARVVGVADEANQVSRMKYHIYFYGTGETAVVKAEDIFPYLEHRNGKLGKPRKLKGFNEALEQIEAELTPDERDKGETVTGDASLDSSALSEGSSTPDRRSSIASSEDKELTKPTDRSISGNKISKSAEFATPESKPAKVAKKRKSEVPDQTATESKKLKAVSPPPQEPTPSSSVLPEENKTPDLTSRSGRKIKPKKFSDFDEAFEDVRLQKKNSKGAAANEEDSHLTEEELTFVHKGETVKLPLNRHRPECKNHKSMRDWRKEVLDKAVQLKDRVLNGDLSPMDAMSQLDVFSLQLSQNKKQEYQQDDKNYALLQVEGRLLQLDLRIKSSLSLTKSEPDQCLSCMEELASLPITALMLKKNPEVVETFKRLRRYVGNTAVWDMTPEQLSEFEEKAEKIRAKAEHVFSMMKGLFSVPHGASFWSVFTSQLLDFNKVTKKLSQEDFYAIVLDPVPSTSQ